MKVLQLLILIFGITVLVPAQISTQDIITLKGQIIYQKIRPNEVIRIFFEAKEKTSQTTVKDDNSFEIKLPQGIYQVEILADNGFNGYGFKNIKIIEPEPVIFEVEKADTRVLYCPQILPPDINIEPADLKLSTEIMTRPLEELPKAPNKNKRKTINNK